jgi:hypothetical protein
MLFSIFLMFLETNDLYIRVLQFPDILKFTSLFFLSFT